MNQAVRVATNVGELAEALAAPNETEIRVRGVIEGASSLTLRPGVRLTGERGASIGFAPGQDGLVLTADNCVSDIALHADPARNAIMNDADGSFGRMRLHRLRTTGCIRLVPTDAARAGHVDAQDVHVVAADARAVTDRPSAFGVEVVAGAFTLWNRQTSPDDVVSAELRGISAGRMFAPVKGTGVVVGGTAGGGRLVASLLETGEIHSDGGIEPGTADRISGGCFVLQGAEIDSVRNVGSVTTFGANDMVLDNWGQVESWHAEEKICSYGPNGIGFVNLGALGTLTLDALIETHGLGACGFNCGEVKADDATSEAPADATPHYDGTVRQATFERVVTRGDGAVGIQVAVPIGHVRVRSGVETFGGVGASLARGVVTNLAAVALSIKPGGGIRELVIDEGLTTNGAGIEALELHGRIDRVRINGSAGPVGGGFKAG